MPADWAPYHLTHQHSTCRAKSQRLGKFESAGECAAACDRNRLRGPVCSFFIFGRLSDERGAYRGECWASLAADKSCPEGLEPAEASMYALGPEPVADEATRLLVVALSTALATAALLLAAAGCYVRGCPPFSRRPGRKGLPGRFVELRA